jgi:phospholipid-binding lipoprotein MlaA
VPVSSAPGIDDPWEAQNRQVHALNKSIDRAVIRPVAGGAGSGAVGGALAAGLGNLGETVDTPRRIVNNLLQGRIGNAGHNTFRLAVNLVVGVGGLFDPATEFGLEERDTDFGETLHVWGTGEGNYLELPLVGPSTERDAVGSAVDILLNPIGWTEAVGPVALAFGVFVADGVADRSRYGSAIDDVLYDSADSYAQTRLIYLQNRRFELARAGGQAGETPPSGDAGAIDPYADPYGETYIDPYEDIYAQ